MTLRETLALFALAAIWGASYPFIRVAVPAFGPFPLVGARVGIAALVLFVGLRLTGASTDLRPHWRKLLVVGALNAAIPFSLISAAELHVTASLAAMLTATAPMWSALFSAWWLGERIGARRVVGLLLGIAGVGVLVGWSPFAMTPVVALGIGAVIVAAASYSAATVYSRKALASVPPPTIALGQQVAALVLLAIPALVMAPAAQPTTRSVGALVALAVVCTALAYLIFFRLLATIGATRVSTVTYLIPVFGTAWGTLFLHEPLSRGMVAGLAMILLSVLIVNDVRIALPRSLRRAPAGSASAG